MSASRKGKKAWRKNVDVKQIERGIDELNEEKRILGKSIKETTDENLFTIDTAGNTSLKSVMRTKKLKIDEILTPDSLVDGVSTRKHPLSTIVQKIISNGKERKVSKNTLKLMEKYKSKNLGNKPSKLVATKKSKPTKVQDIWSENKSNTMDEMNVQSQNAISTDLLSREFISDFEIKPVKKPKLPAPALPQIVKAVKLDHPGASYHPSFEDHQNALKEAVGHEENRIKEHQKSVRKLRYPKELDEIEDDDFLMSSDEELEEENDDDNVEKIVREQVPRKTAAQRNKERRRKREERLLEIKQKKKMIEAEQEKEIEIFLKTSEEKLDNLDENENELTDKTGIEKVPKRLGPLKFEPDRIAVALTEELPQSLREVKPDLNLFKDRFKSFEERGLIESRLPCTRRRRYKQKVVEVHSYKRFV